ncbi:MAG TPA: hypothetical protein VIR77_00685 [Pontiella sp.]
MDIEVLRAFFGWMTLINLAIFALSTVFCIALRRMIQCMHGRMFGLSPEAINAFLYGYIGLYKILFIVFNLVPWIGLVIMS